VSKLALILLLAASAAAAPPPRWLSQTLSQDLTDAQRGVLGEEPADEALAAALTEPQRQAALARLRAADRAAHGEEADRGIALLSRRGSGADGRGPGLKAADAPRGLPSLARKVGSGRALDQARSWLSGSREDGVSFSGSSAKPPAGLSRAAVRAARAGAPQVPRAGLSYHTDDVRKPWLITELWHGMVDNWNYSHHAMTPGERSRLAELKRQLSSTAAGRQLVEDLGGWAKVERDVSIKFAPISSGSTLAQAFPNGLERADGTTAPFGIALNSRLANAPPELLTSILAHELSHVRDNERYGALGGLAVPSEFQAHRTQVYVYEELMKAAGPKRRQEVEATRDGQYMKFIVSMWEDHIVQRYRTEKDFAAAFKGPKLPKLAVMVYRDLASGRIKPGSPQLDYHVQDLYDAATLESDGGKDKDASPALLAKRARLVAAMENGDAAFRAGHGFQLSPGDR
jgi:hypothetical protein